MSFRREPPRHDDAAYDTLAFSMRSRAARLGFGAAALIAIGAAGFFLFRSEQQIAVLKSTLRGFDVHARETTDAIGELRVAQQAYVAEGQGLATTSRAASR